VAPVAPAPLAAVPAPDDVPAAGPPPEAGEPLEDPAPVSPFDPGPPPACPCWPAFPSPCPCGDVGDGVWGDAVGGALSGFPALGGDGDGSCGGEGSDERDELAQP